MENNIDKIIEIYKSLAKCSNHEEVRSLKVNLEVVLSGQSGAHVEFSLKKGETSCSAIDQLGRNLDNIVGGVKKLIDRGRFPDGLTNETPEENAVRLRAPELVGKMFQRNMDEIWKYLMGDEVSTIGVLGMGGVGKTTLLKHVYNKSLENPLFFDFVCWVKVPQDCNIRDLQSEIANQLSVDLSKENDITRRAGILAWTLEKKNRFVLFLDDVWEHFDVENEVGIPKQNGCKLILTTRSEVMCNRMFCDKTIKVNPLLEEEAWTLFVKYVGQNIENHAHLVDLAKLVCKECACLPIAIITLASSMRNNFEEYEWRNVLRKLRDSITDVEDMEENVFKLLRFSYERLNDLKAQNCLLYCSTYSEDLDLKKEDLIWRCIDMGLFDELVSIREKIDQGLSILDKLEKACLLSQDEFTVKMHDLIRDMALQIAGSRFVVKSYLAKDDFLNEKRWSTEDLEVAVFMSASGLSDDVVSWFKFINFCEGVTHISPYWPSLTTLVLQYDEFESVADCFFLHICGLKVLDLSMSNIGVLPKSISHLRNLTSLSLRKCWHLKYVPSLSKLKALERLDLYEAGI